MDLMTELNNIETNINALKTSLISALTNKGMILTGGESFKTLIDKVNELSTSNVPDYDILMNGWDWLLDSEIEVKIAAPVNSLAEDEIDMGMMVEHVQEESLGGEITV